MKYGIFIMYAVLCNYSYLRFMKILIYLFIFIHINILWYTSQNKHVSSIWVLIVLYTLLWIIFYIVLHVLYTNALDVLQNMNPWSTVTELTYF